MSRPIEATPIITGKSAKKFLEDLEKTNKLLENPVYRAKKQKHLNECEKLWECFQLKLGFNNMAIKPKCCKCNKELTEYGGLLISPPDNDGKVDKKHICVKCYEKEFMIKIKPTREPV